MDREAERRRHAQAIAELEARVDHLVRHALQSVLHTVLARMGLVPGALTAAGELSLDDLSAIPGLWRHQVEEAMLPVLAEMYGAGALAAVIRYSSAGTGAPAPPPLPNVAQLPEGVAPSIPEVVDMRGEEYLARASNRLVGVGDTVWRDVRDTLADGMGAGESVPSLAARVESTMASSVERATTIARTEVVGAANAGSLAGVQALGGAAPGYKQWLATLDSRTRECHAAADGQTVALADSFDVCGEALDHPGDPAGSAGQVVNCRCTLLFVDQPEDGIEAEDRQTGGPVVPPPLPAEVPAPDPSAVAARTASTAQPAPDGTIPGMPPTATAHRWTADGAFLNRLRSRMHQEVQDAQARARQLLAVGDQPTDMPVDPAVAPEPGAPVAVEDLGSLEGMRGVELLLAVEGRWTGDGRCFLPEALVWDGMLPFSLTASHDDHPDCVVGVVTEVERVAGPDPDTFLIVGRGFLDVSTEDGQAVARKIETHQLRGVSVDVDDMELGGVDPATVDDPEDLWWLMVVEHARLRALALTAIPAFAEAYITLDPGGIDTSTLPPATTETATPLPQEELPPPEPAEAMPMPIILASADAFRIVAAAPQPDAPPEDWFQDPGLQAPTALTVTADGRVYGHLALWGQCHRGIMDECVMAPRSTTNYAGFRVGEVLCSSGQSVAVGHLTVGTGHADLGLGWRPAASHYDSTGTSVAMVACGEDTHGVWVAGMVNPAATPDQVVQLRAHPLSGDWRRMGNSLELVAALCVNVPGFLVPRSRVASGCVRSLVSAGAYRPRDVHLDRAAHRIAASIGRDPASRARELAARVHGVR